VALGYLGKPGLTAERFVEIAEGHARSRGYRTGDRARRGSDGLIEYLGRFDDQVKIDGHRIEPGEIERVAMGLPGVDECRVLVRLSPTGQKRLVAYVVMRATAGRDQLRSAVAEKLPAYMVPHFFAFVDAMPINANGKLDKARLPDPFAQTAARALGASAEAEKVFSAWTAVLGHSALSDDVNFFDAGGTSIEAVKLHAVLVQGFGRPLEPTFVFEHPTMRRQAEALRPGVAADASLAHRGAQRRAALSRNVRGQR
jgi:hypothetical protein